MAAEETKTKKAGTPSYKTFCRNFSELRQEDVEDPVMQSELEKIAKDAHFPVRVRKLAQKFLLPQKKK